MAEPRRVLIVSYYFPPRDDVGALRAAKLATYLPSFGWTADVLTAGGTCAHRTELGADGGIVVHTPAGVGPRQAYLRLRAWRRSPRGEPAGPDLTFAEKDVGATRPLGRLIQTGRSLLWCPDDAIGWWRPAVRAARWMRRRRGYAAMITTGPPQTAHLVGLALARGTRNWIADFRDPWLHNPGKPRFVRSALSDALDALGERAVMRRARHIVVGTDGLETDLRRRHPELADRIAVIAPGVDRADFAGVRQGCPDRFRLVHAGTIYYRRSPAPLFEAVASLLAQRQLPRAELEIVLAGRSGDGIDPAALAAQYGLSDVLRLPGQLPRQSALELMASAGALVILAQDQPNQVPAKLYEYLGAGPSIVAVTGPGATRRMLEARPRDRGACAEGGPALEAAVLRAYRTWREASASGRPPEPPDIPPELDRRFLTGKVAALLDAGRP